jgi:hypothetical protein
MFWKTFLIPTQQLLSVNLEISQPSDKLSPLNLTSGGLWQVTESEGD